MTATSRKPFDFFIATPERSQDRAVTTDVTDDAISADLDKLFYPDSTHDNLGNKKRQPRKPRPTLSSLDLGNQIINPKPLVELEIAPQDSSFVMTVGLELGQPWREQFSSLDLCGCWFWNEVSTFTWVPSLGSSASLAA
jgi:hypothetical protein